MQCDSQSTNGLNLCVRHKKLDQLVTWYLFFLSQGYDYRKLHAAISVVVNESKQESVSKFSTAATLNGPFIPCGFFNIHPQ